MKTTTKESKALHTPITLLITGSGARRIDDGENELLLRTDDATLHFKRESEFGKLAHALVDRYNHYQSLTEKNKILAESNRELVEALFRFEKLSNNMALNWIEICRKFSTIAENAITKAKEINTSNINQNK